MFQFSFLLSQLNRKVLIFSKLDDPCTKLFLSSLHLIITPGSKYFMVSSEHKEKYLCWALIYLDISGKNGQIQIVNMDHLWFFVKCYFDTSQTSPKNGGRHSLVDQHLPSCSPGFESLTQHECFLSLQNWNCNNICYWNGKE